MNWRTATCLALSFLMMRGAIGQTTENKAQELARELWRASGGENWPKVKRLRFTFVVEQDGKELVAARHDWDVMAGTDRVQWKGKDVTVNLRAPGDSEDAKAAHARWINDSYWLLAPLKVLDPGVKLTYEGRSARASGTFELLRLAFDQVGLTPGDQYIFYIDPATKLLRAWDYIPKPETVMHGTWDKYEDFGGLKLATAHDFGGKMIRFADIEVTAD